MTRFATITLGLVALLAVALWAGGWIVWAALAYVTVFATWADRMGALAAPDDSASEFPAGTALSVALGLAHFPLLFGGALVLAGGEMAPVARLALFGALGLFLGQVSNSNAHELIHRGDRRVRRLGVAVYVALLFGHHASAHPRVHHIWVATDRDPNSARLGEGFWRFLPRAWWGSFRAGWRAETALRRRAASAPGPHPYRIYAAGAVLCLTGVWLAGGARALGVYVALCIYAQMQLLLSDYVQHYGLRRARTGPDKWAPVGPAHSWNAPHGFTAGLMLNAPRHSDHHANPGRAYPGLRLDRTAMPMLPHSLPVMASLALIPPLWRRVMDRRARAWRGQARQEDGADRVISGRAVPDAATAS